MAVLLQGLGTTLLISLLFVVGFTATGIVYQLRQINLKKRVAQESLVRENEMIQAHKMLNLVSETADLD